MNYGPFAIKSNLISEIPNTLNNYNTNKIYILIKVIFEHWYCTSGIHPIATNIQQQIFQGRLNIKLFIYLFTFTFK